MSKSIKPNRISPVLPPTLGMTPKAYKEYLSNYSNYVAFVENRRAKAVSGKAKEPKNSDAESSQGLGGKSHKGEKKKSTPLSPEVMRERKLAKNRRKRAARKTRNAKKRISSLALQVKETRLSKTLSSLKSKTSPPKPEQGGDGSETKAEAKTVAPAATGERPKKRGPKKKKTEVVAEPKKAPQQQRPAASKPLTGAIPTPPAAHSAASSSFVRPVVKVDLDEKVYLSPNELTYTTTAPTPPSVSGPASASRSTSSQAAPPAPVIRKDEDIYLVARPGGEYHKMTRYCVFATLDRSLIDPANLKTYYLKGSGDVIYCDGRYEGRNFNKSGNGFVLKECTLLIPDGPYAGKVPKFDRKFAGNKYYLSHAYALEG